MVFVKGKTVRFAFLNTPKCPEDVRVLFQNFRW